MHSLRAYEMDEGSYLLRALEGRFCRQGHHMRAT